MYIITYGGEFENHSVTDDFAVVSAGYALIEEGNTGACRPNGLPDYQIIYVRKGICHLEADNGIIPVTEHNAVFFRPNEKQIYSYFKDEGTEVYFVHFGGQKAKEIISLLNLFNQKIMYINDDELITNTVKALTVDMTDKLPGYEISAAGKLLTMLAELSRNKEPQGLERNGIIKAICKKIRLNYNSKETNADYARECGMSVSYFLDRFKKETGTSPNQYKINCKINVAKHLLISTNQSIKSISSFVGFEDSMYFCKYFKGKTNLTPSEFRNRYSPKN